MRYPNIQSLFAERVDQFRSKGDQPGRDVFYFRSEGHWRGISWDRFAEETQDLATALLSLGLSRNASVCILMGNVPEWPIADLGTIMAGGVGVGLYPTSSAEQCAYIINHSDAEFVFVDTQAQLQKVLSVRSELPKLKRIVVLDQEESSTATVIRYGNLIARGRLERERFAAQLENLSAATIADDIAIMVYTSGTTGPPKGACLSHRYIINSVESLSQVIPLFDTDASFSYLPFCHVAERISGLYNRLYAGASAYFVDDLSRLAEYMLEVKPTVFASLPRFFEKIHARIVADVESGPQDERSKFMAALELGRQVASLSRSGRQVPPSLATQHERYALPLLQRVKDYFGGRIRIATSGGAPLPLEVAAFFDAAGLPILQAYGLTENVCVSFNRPDRHKFGTVGPPMPGCEVKIASDGEILVRSEMMFSGYYNAPEETAAVFRDGWLLTGDLGQLDEDGFLSITGRKKELIVTSTGKKVSPALLENMLKEHHLISQALVYGEGKSYLVALLTLNALELADYARFNKLPYTRNEELAGSTEVVSLIQEWIDRINARLSSTESIRRFAILNGDFQIETGELTPTGKLRRNVIHEHYYNVIEDLYAVASAESN
ncbi:MAG TPA: long-chain fatty acid--CoA ligase [Pyrinomonadaceae bacterium]|nr:long-chain fatty acid--CoA ligase [Pyrinomonadaceae bacterium]